MLYRVWGLVLLHNLGFNYLSIVITIKKSSVRLCNYIYIYIYIYMYIHEGESKSKGKIHLTALIAVTVSNFTYHFLHSPLATQCICYIVQLVSVFLRRRSFLAARC